jgi:hypothetical protein
MFEKFILGKLSIIFQPAERLEESRRRAAARRRVRPSKAFRKLGTPPPVDGRHHTNIQTDINLEEVPTIFINL